MAIFLSAILVENFKSIEFLTCDLHKNFNYILGLNGNGKSNLLKAVNAVLSCKVLTREDIFQENEMKNILIELDFKEFKLRRVYSTGEDAYFINGRRESRKCFKEYVQEKNLISPLYYVEQNRISQLVNYSPTELYGFLEEACSFKYCMEKIDRGREKLNFLNEDIETIRTYLDDTRVYLRKLRKDHQTAEEVMNKKVELVNLNNLLYAGELQKYRTRLKELQEDEQDRTGKKEELHTIERELLKFSAVNEGVEDQFKKILCVKTGVRERVENVKNNLSAIEEELRKIEMQKNFLTRKQAHFSKREIKNKLKILREKNSFSPKKNIENLIGERKELWRKENILKTEFHSKQKEMKRMKNILKISDEENVIFNFIEFVSTALKAVGAVASHLLFAHVVQTKEEAICLLNNLKKEGIFFRRIVCLEQINFTPYYVEDENLIRLSSLIRLKDGVDGKYLPLIELLCNNYYVVQDLNMGYYILNRMKDRRLKLITVNGERVMHGSLTVSFQKYDLGNFYALKNEIAEMEKLILAGEESIRKLNREIELYGLESNQSVEEEIAFLEVALKFHGNEQLLSEENLSQKIKQLNFVKGEKEEQLKKLLLEEEKIEQQYCHLKYRKEQYDTYVSLLRRKTVLEREFNFQLKEKINLEENLYVSKISRLRNKIDLLKQKIGNVKLNSDWSQEEVLREKEKIETFLKNKNVNEENAKLFTNLKGKYEEILSENSRLAVLFKKIMKYITSLERTSENQLNEFIGTFSTVFDQYRTLLPFDNIEMEIERKNRLVLFTKNNLSGGERALLSVLLILAVELSCSSQIILFDEIDSSVDRKNKEIIFDCLKILRQSGKQIISVTFNDGLLPVGDNFIKIEKNKASCISLNEAVEFLK